MNGSDVKYTSEYVEIQTSLEHIRTKLDIIDRTLGDIQQSYAGLLVKVEQNQLDLAGVKATAAIFGGLAGSLLTAVLRLFFIGNA